MTQQIASDVRKAACEVAQASRANDNRVHPRGLQKRSTSISLGRRQSSWPARARQDGRHWMAVAERLNAAATSSGRSDGGRVHNRAEWRRGRQRPRDILARGRQDVVCSRRRTCVEEGADPIA